MHRCAKEVAIARPLPTLDLDLPRLSLGSAPTPVRLLPGASNAGEAPVWIKDDGVFGRYAGNKARKLEWLLGDALARQRRTVITGGAIGTNHGLATALYCRDLGLDAALVLVPQPEDEHVRSQLRRIRASGAELRFASGKWRAFALAGALIATRTVREDASPLPDPSRWLGAAGLRRLRRGRPRAGTPGRRRRDPGAIPRRPRAGQRRHRRRLLLGLKLAGLRSRLVCVLVNDLTPLSARGVARLARRSQRLIRRRSVGPSPPRTDLRGSDLDLETGWLGEGYGHPTAAGAEAISAFAADGVALEPVYTAKAAAALLALNAAGRFGLGPVLYWHTYRAPADDPA